MTTDIADFVVAVLTAPIAAAAVQTNTYRTLLQQHDWAFSLSKDSAVYAAGFEQRRVLEILRRELDPDYEVWNSLAPEPFHNGAGAS